MTNGFTLTELLVILAIFVIVAVGIFSILFLTQKGLIVSQDLLDINHQGRKILEHFSREIRQAREIVTELPEVDSGDNPSEIEFEDGHTPSPCGYLGSDYYYIRYYLFSSDGQPPYQLRRQYRVYCFDDCSLCDTFYRWSETRTIDGPPEQVHPCNLGESVAGIHLTDLEFWGEGLININLFLEKGEKSLNLKTKISGRNL